MKIDTIIQILATLRPDATFLSLKGYTNDHGEVADHQVCFHISYENALKESLAIVKRKRPKDDLGKQARQELITSYSNSLTRLAAEPLEERDDNWRYFIDENGSLIKGIKVFIPDGTLFLYGLLHRKQVLSPGVYPEVKHRPLTLAKDKLRQSCPVERFRHYRIKPERVNEIRVENLSMLVK